MPSSPLQPNRDQDPKYQSAIPSLLTRIFCISLSTLHHSKLSRILLDEMRLPGMSLQKRTTVSVPRTVSVQANTKLDCEICRYTQATHTPRAASAMGLCGLSMRLSSCQFRSSAGQQQARLPALGLCEPCLCGLNRTGTRDVLTPKQSGSTLPIHLYYLSPATSTRAFCN